MSYAGSASSADELHADFFSTAFSPSFSNRSTSPSSLGSPSDVQGQWSQLKRNTDSFIANLLRMNHGQETALRAWRVRCDALEAEVLRLSGLVAQLDREKQAVARSLEEKEMKKAAVVTEEVQTAPSFTASTPTQPACDCSPTCPAPTPCRWTGARWEPVTPSTRPKIDANKPMSRQNPPPCNAFYLVGHCDVPRCRFEHGYELEEEQVAEMRRGAKHHVCNAVRNSVPCPDEEDCIYGHVCPRGPSCGRDRCGFNDEQHLVLPSPRPVIRRR
ncbi:hypothetical protein JCM11641_000239 [Rhodosporidiobolus odoratus]